MSFVWMWKPVNIPSVYCDEVMRVTVMTKVKNKMCKYFKVLIIYIFQSLFSILLANLNSVLLFSSCNYFSLSYNAFFKKQYIIYL